jgi:hypothetical protein
LRIVLALLTWLVAAPAQAYQPFFDDDPATLHAPQEPRLTDLDLDVLLLCGGWGAPVEAVDFEAMMLKDEHREALQRIHQALGGRIFSSTEDMPEFVHQLRRVWFEQKGFHHVFCGEPGIGKDLGGLHYAPRYWQAQDQGWAGYRKLERDPDRRPVEKCRQFYLREQIRPPIYSISLAFDNPEEPDNNVKCLTGYHLQMDAERLLIAGTQAFKQANRRVGKNVTEACLVETSLPGVERHFSTLVIRQRALRSFYPLAERKPYCHKNKRDYRDCLCSRL